MMKKQFGTSYLLISAVLAVLFILVGVYIWQQSTNSTKGILYREGENKQSKIELLGVYELRDTVHFTVNKPVYFTLYHWVDPAYKTESALPRGTTARSYKLDKGYGYQLKAYDDQTGENFLSNVHFFEGAKRVIDDHRCPKYVKYLGQNQVEAVCDYPHECRKEIDFIQEYCPATTVDH